MIREFQYHTRIEGTEEQWADIDNAVSVLTAADTLGVIQSIGIYGKSIENGKLWKNISLYVLFKTENLIPEPIAVAMDTICEKHYGSKSGRICASAEFDDTAFPEEGIIVLWTKEV